MKEKRRKNIIIMIVILGCILFCFWQNNDLTNTYYTYDAGETLKGYKIVQISDLHNKRFGKNQTRLLKAIGEYEPDVIVVTGDIVDSNHTDIDIAIEFIKGAVDIAPVYYVTGNHENWLEEETRQELIDRIEEAGAVYLCNETVTIDYQEAEFILAGLDNANLRDDTLQEITKDIKEEQFVMLLAHEPQNIKRYSEAPVDMILSGHAHGGQVRLPLIGGLVAPDQGLFPEYTEGLHKEGNSSMIISRGLGNSVIPVRIFNRPEIVCIEFT